MCHSFISSSNGKVEYRKGHDLVLLAFREFSRRHKDAVLVTAWHSPWPQLSAGFQGKLSHPLELTRDGRIDIKAWVTRNGDTLPASTFLGVMLIRPSSRYGSEVREYARQ